MSAVNVIKSADAVHVLTDGSAVLNGEISGYGRKCHVIPHAQTALAAVGTLGVLGFTMELAFRAGTFDDVLKLTPGCLEWMFKLMEGHLPALDRSFELHAVGWSTQRARIEHWLLSNVGGGPVEASALQWQRFEDHSINPPLSADVLAAAGFTAERFAAFDPMTDGAALVDLQRRHWGRRVGVFVQCDTITHDAITSRIIHRYPEDVVGQKIEESDECKTR